MKPLRLWSLSLAGAGLLLLLFVNTPGLADKRTPIKLLDAATATGPSNAVVSSEFDEAGAKFVFQFHATGNGAAKIESSLDRSVWFTEHTFTGTDDRTDVAVCGGCYLRANATSASGGNTVTVLVSLSGAQKVLAPTFTATPTLTPSRTPTLTPTATPSLTPTHA